MKKKNKDKLLIVGIGTTAIQIYNFATHYSLFEVIGFAVNEKYYKNKEFLNSHVYKIEELDNKIDKNNIHIFVAMQWNRLNKDRKDLYLNLKQKGYKFGTLISPNAIIQAGVKVGENCWISDNVVIESSCNIERNVFVKSNVWIGHLSEVKQHSFIGACSVIGGEVIIEEQCFVGMGSIVFNQINIGKKCIIGSGTIIKKSLSDFSIVKTKSDNYIIESYSEETIENKLLANYYNGKFNDNSSS
jgi:sugar O-acyltransferase (sialic acid O-acetyltransferase NeuD family)